MDAAVARRLALSLAALLAAGALLAPAESLAWKERRRQEPALLLGTAAGGPAAVLGVIGGFRSSVASACFLAADAALAERDPAAVRAWLGAAVAADPRPLFFWLNGARVLAADLPRLEMPSVAREEALPRSRRRVEQEAAGEALRWLEQARHWHPQEPLLVLEMASVQERRMKNLDAAARLYLEASRLPGAPAYAARLHAEALRRLGRPREAYRFYRALYASLPEGDAASVPWVVYDRIRALERELGLPEAERLRGSRPRPPRPESAQPGAAPPGPG